MTRQGFEAYKLYLALQRHFSTSYDFHTYNGKVKVSTEAYAKRKDMYSFEKLTKVIPEEDQLDFFISHFLKDPKAWIKDMKKGTMDEYQVRLKNMPNIFKEDVHYLLQWPGSEWFVCEPSDIPMIHKQTISKNISIETIIILDSIRPFIDDHADTVKVPFVFPDHINRLRKYRPFLLNRLNKETYKDILKSAIK